MSNPCYPPSQPQIPTELAFLAGSETVTVCAFIIHSQILIIQRHSYFPCLGGGGGKKKTGKKYLSHQNPTEIRMYRNGILLVIWPNPPGTLAKLLLGVDSMGAAKFLKVYKDEISHQFTNVKCDELSDVCVMCKELGIIGKWFLETEMKVLTFAH